MKIRETENEFVLREVPVFFWIVGFFGTLMFGGGFVMLLYFAFSDPREAFSSHDGSFAGSVMAVIIYLGFLLFLAVMTGLFTGFLFSSAITTCIDGSSKTITVSRHNLLRKRVERYEVRQARGFSTDEVRTRRGATYFVCLKLRNDQQIEIEGKGTSSDEAEKIAERMNAFLGLT